MRRLRVGGQGGRDEPVRGRLDQRSGEPSGRSRNGDLADRPLDESGDDAVAFVGVGVTARQRFSRAGQREADRLTEPSRGGVEGMRVSGVVGTYRVGEVLLEALAEGAEYLRERRRGSR